MDQDPPGLKPIKAFLEPLTESSKGSVTSIVRENRTEPSVAVARAKVLAGCYRKDDAADPETYAMALAAVLSGYSLDIVRQVTDPRSGLPSRSQWLPTVKEVRDACEEIDYRRRAVAQMQKREAEQLAARKAAELNRERRPTYDELKARYGENWGMTPDDEPNKRSLRRTAIQQEANRRAFVAECKAAGVPEDSQISPSLAALIKAGSA